MNTAVLVATLLGVASWSFLEYVIHRWLGHDRRFRPNFFGAEHGAHHRAGDYFAPAWKKLPFAVVLSLALGAPAVLVAGWSIGLAFTGGFVGFYAFYEVMHRLEHTWQGVGPYARWARRHHFYHHFHDPRVNHGVTSPLWDLVFGTYVRPDIIEVPPAKRMRWLCLPGSDEVRPELADSYRLRRPRALSPR